MKKFLVILLVLAEVATCLFAQGTAAPKKSATPDAKKPAKDSASAKSQTPPPKNNAKQVTSPLDKIAGGQSNVPTTTEIYANEAFFDSNKNMGIFSGSVKVTDPRFNLQADKLTIFVSKGENQGLQKAIAEGNVAVVRDRPEPAGSPPSRSVGRAETATYDAITGNVELKGDPRVQEGMNTHVAASPDTVMIINQNGQLSTHGPSRTEIRQQPKEEPKADKKATASPAAKEEKSQKKPEPSAKP